MRTLVRQLLDQQISRRGFVKEMAALGVTVSSAQALMGSLSPASADEAGDEVTVREVTGNGGDLIMETLIEADVEYIFHGCGAGTNTLFDAIVTRPQIKNFLATNEGQCVAMAEGYHFGSGGKLGVVIVPKAGLPNAASNIYNALMDRASVLTITARDSSEFSERQIDLEMVDWEQAMDPFMRSSYKIERVDRASEYTRRAITVAKTPPGWPTFLQITEDMYTQETTANIVSQKKFDAASEIQPDSDQIMEVARMMLEAERPLITVGSEITKTGAQKQMIEFAEMLGLPITGGLSGLADFPNQHPLYLGRFGPFIPQTRNADFYLCIGTQLPDEASYVHRGPPPVNAKTVHMTVETDILGMTYPTEMNVVGSANACIADLMDAVNSLATKRRIKSIRDARYPDVAQFTKAARQRLMTRAQRKWDQAPMTTARISAELNAVLDEDAIIVKEPVYDSDLWFDVGYGKKMLLGGSGAGVLGWATGAALGVKLAQPDRQVVALSGDGAFMFQHNLWALSRYDAPVTIVIYNNNAYNMTRAFSWLGKGAQAVQKKDLLNYLGDPDVNYTLIAKAYGVDAEEVKDPSGLNAAFKRALKANDDGKPYLLDVSNERWGAGGELTWHPDYSIAKMRSSRA